MVITGRFRIGAIVMFAWNATLLGATPIATAAEPSLDEITSSWRTRSSLVKSIDVQWDETRFGKSQEDKSLSGIVRLRFDGIRSRFDDTGEIFSPVDGSVKRQVMSEVVVEGRRTILFSEGSVGYPSAHIEAATLDQSLGDARFLPLSAWLWTLDPLLGPYQGAVIELGEVSRIDGTNCIAVKSGVRTDNQPSVSREVVLWCDPERGFLPLQMEVFVGGELRWDVLIRYRSESETAEIWLPKEWETTMFRKGQQKRKTKATVTSININTSLEDELFHLTFPPGTWVSNYIDKTRHIVRPDGTDRPVRRGEFNGRNYQSLLNSEASSDSTRRTRLTGWILVGNVILIGLILAVIWWRNKLKSNRL